MIKDINNIFHDREGNKIFLYQGQADKIETSHKEVLPLSNVGIAITKSEYITFDKDTPDTHNYYAETKPAEKMSFTKVCVNCTTKDNWFVKTAFQVNKVHSADTIINKYE